MLNRDLKKDNIYVYMGEQRVWWLNQIRSKYIDITLNKDLWAGLDNAPTQDIIVNIHCEGEDLSDRPGADVDILYPGTRDGAQLYFGVQIQENDYFVKEKINNKYITKLNTKTLFNTNNIEQSIFQK